MFLPRNFKPLLAFLLIIQFTHGSEDHGGPYAPEEPLLVNERPPVDITENDLRDLPLSDPKLRVAYAYLIRSASSWGPVADQHNPQGQEILKDVIRRGDSATPLWLDIMTKNPNTVLECFIPNVIDRIGNIKMEPYLDYLQQMIKTRPDEINASAAGAALAIFFKHGTAGEVKVVQALAKKGPNMASAIQLAFESEERRLTAPPTKTPQSIPTSTPDQTASPPSREKAPATKPAQAVPGEEPASSAPWLAVMSLSIGAALALLWFLIRRRS